MHLRFNSSLEGSFPLDPVKLRVLLGFYAKENSSSIGFAQVVLKAFKVFLYHRLELILALRAKQFLPIGLFSMPHILLIALTVRVNYIAALILKEEALSRIVEHLVVDVVHLPTLNLSHDVQVVS